MARPSEILQHLPALLVLAPLIGAASLGISRFGGPDAVRRTLWGNAALTAALGLLLLIGFDTDPQRDELPPSESFQQRTQSSWWNTPDDEFQSASGDVIPFGPLFAVDGLSLWPLLLAVFAVPLLLSGVRQQFPLSSSAAAALLLWQSATIALLAAADVLTFVAALFLSTGMLAWLLAARLPTGSHPQLSGWLRHSLLSNFLIAGGMLGLFAGCAQVLSTIEEISLPSFADLLDIWDYLLAEEPEVASQLQTVTTTASALIVCGALLRLPVVPFHRQAARLWREAPAELQPLLWIHGAATGTAIVLRSLQLAPVPAFRILALLAPLFALGVLWYGLLALAARRGLAATAVVPLQAAALVGLGLCSGNETALTAVMLLIVAVACVLPWLHTSNGNGTPLALIGPAAAALLVLGGVLQGQGVGSRGLSLCWWAGAGLACTAAAALRNGTVSTKQAATPSRLFAPEPPPETPSASESPEWRPAGDSPTEAADAPGSGFRWAALAALAASLGVALVPAFFWQPISADVIKLRFPLTAPEFGAAEESSPPPPPLTSGRS